MAENLYVVTGAAGNVGKIVADRLLAQGKRVRVIGRAAAKLEAHKKKGAEVREGSLEDAAFLTKAFEGATAVYAMIPTDFSVRGVRAFQNRVADAIATAVEKAGVKYVVTLSSVGANRSEGVGPVNGLYDMEQRFNRIPQVNVLHLRPGYFMENLLGNIGMIKGMNIHGGPARADVPIALIATQDIGEVAARRLAALDFQGTQVQELLGPRDVTMTEVTQALGAAIGKPDLKYVAFSYEDARKGMVGAGLPPEFADLYVELNKAFNEGTAKATQPRSAQTTTPTSIEDFAKNVFAPAFKAS